MHHPKNVPVHAPPHLQTARRPIFKKRYVPVFPPFFYLSFLLSFFSKLLSLFESRCSSYYFLSPIIIGPRASIPIPRAEPEGLRPQKIFGKWSGPS